MGTGHPTKDCSALTYHFAMDFISAAAARRGSGGGDGHGFKVGVTGPAVSPREQGPNVVTAARPKLSSKSCT